MIMTLLCVHWCGVFLELPCCNRDDIRVNVFCPCECVLLSVRMVLFCHGLRDCALFCRILLYGCFCSLCVNGSILSVSVRVIVFCSV